MNHIHPIFDKILSSQGFGNGRKLDTHELNFTSKEALAAFLEGPEWVKLTWGYGARIVSREETRLVYECSNSCD